MLANLWAQRPSLSVATVIWSHCIHRRTNRWFYHRAKPCKQTPSGGHKVHSAATVPFWSILILSFPDNMGDFASESCANSLANRAGLLLPAGHVSASWLSFRFWYRIHPDSMTATCSWSTAAVDCGQKMLFFCCQMLSVCVVRVPRGTRKCHRGDTSWLALPCTIYLIWFWSFKAFGTILTSNIYIWNL